VAWRDPWLLADPAGHGVLAFVCARSSEGPADERGVVGLARSVDLRTWSIEGPVYAPGIFGQLEVPQILAYAGYWHLLFCTPADSHGARWRRARPATTGTYHVVGAGPTGPFTTAPQLLAPRAATTHYAGKLHVVDGALVYLATVADDGAGSFRGDLADPVALTCRHDGHLVADREQLGPGRGR
jgi:beta-fructofuranosidase